MFTPNDNLYQSLSGHDDFSATFCRYINLQERQVKSSIIIKAPDFFIDQLPQNPDVHFRGGLIIEGRVVIFITVFKLGNRLFDITFDCHSPEAGTAYVLTDLAAQAKIEVNLVGPNKTRLIECDNHLRPVAQRLLESTRTVPPWTQSDWITSVLKFYAGFKNVEAIWKRMDLSKTENITDNHVHLKPTQASPIKPPFEFGGFSRN